MKKIKERNGFTCFKSSSKNLCNQYKYVACNNEGFTVFSILSESIYLFNQISEKIITAEGGDWNLLKAVDYCKEVNNMKIIDLYQKLDEYEVIRILDNFTYVLIDIVHVDDYITVDRVESWAKMNVESILVNNSIVTVLVKC